MDPDGQEAKHAKCNSSTGSMATLSTRGRECIQPLPEYLQRSFVAWSDEYHPTKNPGGFINLAIAENLLSMQYVARQMSSAPPIPPSNLTYDRPEHFNGVIARFLSTHITNCAVSPNHIVVLNGATAVVDALATVLCDPGDKVLTTGPGYRGLELDVSGRAGAEIVIAALDDSSVDRNPLASVPALEKAWVDAGGTNSRIRMAIICSPNNPTGEVLPKDTVLDIVHWGRSKGLHLIFDEVYAKSVHSESVQFCSVAEALDGDLGIDVHIVWTFSKDLCVSGARIGVLYSQSSELLESINSFLAHFSSTSRHTQWALEHLLTDNAWLNEYFESNRRRLRVAYLRFIGILEELGIPYMPADAGFFVWVNLRRWMQGVSREHEMELWRKICDCKVLLTPASQCFGSQYGYFRVCFAAVDIATCELAWNKISENVLGDNTNAEQINPRF